MFGHMVSLNVTSHHHRVLSCQAPCNNSRLDYCSFCLHSVLLTKCCFSLLTPSPTGCPLLLSYLSLTLIDLSPNLNYSRICPNPGHQQPNPRIPTATILVVMKKLPRITGTMTLKSGFGNGDKGNFLRF